MRTSRTALYLGAGSSKPTPRIVLPGIPPEEKVFTLDLSPSHRTSLVADLNHVPWPFQDDTFDTIHAYEIMEHLGSQGDYKAFFAHFYEIWRLLKPKGLLYISCPNVESPWVLGEPGHTRVIFPWTLNFLWQGFYDGIGRTTTSDYRDTWKGNLSYLFLDDSDKKSSWFGVLLALKETN